MSIHDEGPTIGSAAHSDPNPFPNLRQRRRRGLRITTAAAVALGLAVGGGAVANAAGSGSSSASSTPATPGGFGGHDGPGAFGGTPPAAMGTVASVGTNTFTLTTHDGTTVTVDVSGSTTYLDPGVTAPSVADVKVGSHVAVFGTDTSNTVTATKVTIGGPGGPGGTGGHGGPSGFGAFGGTPPAAMGTVASVGTNTFTLTSHDGTTVTVDVSGSTTYLDPGVTAPSVADVKVGSHVAVFGTDTSNTVTAIKVTIGGPGGPGGTGGHGGPGGPGAFGGTPPAAMGTVASVGANTFTLTTRDNTTVTVDVSPSTTYMDRGVTSASIADVTVGARVVVFGTDTSNTVTATKVGIGGPQGGPGGPGDGDGDGPVGPPPVSGTSSNTSSTSTGSSVTA